MASCNFIAHGRKSLGKQCQYNIFPDHWVSERELNPVQTQTG